MSDELLKWMVVGSGITVVVSFWVDVYAEFFVLEKVEAQLMNCTVVTDAKRRWDDKGYIGRRRRSVAVNLALTSTRLLSKHGMVDVDQVRGISVSQRRWMCIPLRVAATGLVTGSVALALLGRLW